MNQATVSFKRAVIVHKRGETRRTLNHCFETVHKYLYLAQNEISIDVAGCPMRIFLFSLLFSAFFCSSLFASLNRDGLQGVNKTHSAKTMQHSKMGVGVFLSANTDAKLFEDRGNAFQLTMYQQDVNDNTTINRWQGSINNFLGLNAYPFLSIGLSNYFDIAIALPVYYEKLSVEAYETETLQISNRYLWTGMEKSGIGDARWTTKIRAPIPEDDYIIDLALIVGGTLPTTNNQGAYWLREAEYLDDRTTSVDSTGAPLAQYTVKAHGIKEVTWKAGAAMTLDFHRLFDPKPFMLHLSGMKRLVPGNYSSVTQLSGALEFTPIPFIGIYGEYYTELLDKPFTNVAGEEISVALSSIAVGGMIHTDVGIELYLGTTIAMGSNNYIPNVQSADRNEITRVDVVEYNSRILPAIAADLGVTWNGFLIPQDDDKDGIINKEDGCPYDAEDEDGYQDHDGCPDPDNDGDGIYDLDDQCPDQPEDMDGFMDEDGCPDPDNDGDGIPDLRDRCPLDAGPSSNDGCAFGNPDTDKDEVCDAWVSEKGALDDFEGVCTGVDACPNQAGVLENDGCPLGEADSDGDSLCAAWVSEKGLMDKYADVCSGLDKCPNEKGPEWNNGCPAKNPDLDKDSVCDPWVAQENVLDQYADICSGVDKCPTDSGSVENGGCPMADPDIDDDGMCDAWVAEKGMLMKFAETCKGIDKCPNKAGPEENEGCPAKPIEKKVTLKGVNFKTGTAELTFEAKQILNPVADQLLAFEDVKIEIWGHTDDRGGDDYNQKLSEQRAQSVVDYFVTKGVARDRMKAIGKGEEVPVASNKTASGRAQNRRIEMYRVE